MENSFKVWNWYCSGYERQAVLWWKEKLSKILLIFSYTSHVVWIKLGDSTVLLCCRLNTVTVRGDSWMVSQKLRYGIVMRNSSSAHFHWPELVTWTKGGLRKGLGNCRSMDIRKEVYLKSNLFIFTPGCEGCLLWVLGFQDLRI